MKRTITIARDAKYEVHAKEVHAREYMAKFRVVSCDASTVSSDTDTRHRRFRCSHLRLPEYARAPSFPIRAAAAHEG